MKIKLRGVEHEFDPSRVTFGEAILIERTTGLTFTEWAKATGEGSLTGLAVYVLVLLRRDDDKVTMADVEALDLSEFEMVKEPADEAAAEAAELAEAEPVADPT